MSAIEPTVPKWSTVASLAGAGADAGETAARRPRDDAAQGPKFPSGMRIRSSRSCRPRQIEVLAPFEHRSGIAYPVAPSLYDANATK